MKVLNYNKENYICPKGEESFYHCVIEVKKFDAESGERLSRPRVQKFDKKFFDGFGLHNLRQQGYTVTILHDPTEWEETQSKITQAQQIETKKEEEEKEKAWREKIKAELRKEIMLELNNEAKKEKSKGRKPKEEVKEKTAEGAETNDE